MSGDRPRGRAGVEQRDRIRFRDKGLCQSCFRAGLVRQGVEVDHIIARVRGGNDEDENLELLCKRCHDIKTDKDMGRKPRTQFTPDGSPIW
jgi:5-methylcytosine-specific restriction endonuclease McrA